MLGTLLLSDKDHLDRFFGRLEDFGEYQNEMVAAYPKRLHINPEVLRKLSTREGFFQREELRSVQVTEYSPIVGLIKFTWGVVTIREDYEEPFLHFE